jgi:hypothetical protein
MRWDRAAMAGSERAIARILVEKAVGKRSLKVHICASSRQNMRQRFRNSSSSCRKELGRRSILLRSGWRLLAGPIWNGKMEGALLAGRRAVEEVLRSPVGMEPIAADPS